MQSSSLPSEFEWDKYNISHIKDGHNIEPHECEEVFLNLPLTIKPDVIHSHNEEREHALGKTNTGKVLFITFTIRNKKIRVITARDIKKKERRVFYETI